MRRIDGRAPNLVRIPFGSCVDYSVGVLILLPCVWPCLMRLRRSKSPAQSADDDDAVVRSPMRLGFSGGRRAELSAPGRRHGRSHPVDTFGAVKGPDPNFKASSGSLCSCDVWRRGNDERDVMLRAMTEMSSEER